MSLFSRKKALVAMSIGALSALAACGDDVTVDVQPTQITLSPAAATINIGETVSFSAQITGGSQSNVPTLASCTSSNTAVATAAVNAGACRVTGVSAGNVTITGTTSDNRSAGVAVSVNAAQAAINTLSVSPTTANLAVGQTVTLAPNVNRANNNVQVNYAFASSNPAVAQVNATTGVVTAVAPGIATITVTANGTGTGFTATQLVQAITVNVSNLAGGITTLTVQPTNLQLGIGQTSQIASSVQQPAGANAATVTYSSNTPSVATVNPTTGVVTAVGQGNAVITVTATSTANGQFAATTTTQLVQVTVSPPAQISIANITRGTTDQPVDVNNVQGQIQVLLNVTPNNQNITSVQVYLCNNDPGAAETDAQCTAAGRRIAAQQTFTGSTANVSQVNLFVNTADFDAPNFTTGADVNTFYKNGQKRVIATASTGTSNVASNNITVIYLNNIDGFAVSYGVPTNRANGVDGFTYYGGPDIADSAIIGAASGTGSFTVVPVMYTPGRTILNVTLYLGQDTTALGDSVFNNGAGITPTNFCSGVTLIDSVRPFRTDFGTRATNTAQTALNIGCFGSSALRANGARPRVAPVVLASTDQNRNPGPSVTRLTSVPAVYPRDFRLSTSYRPQPTGDYQPVPLDYRPPSFVASVNGGQAGGVDAGFINGSFAFASGIVTTGAGAENDDGVGLPTTLNTTSFSVFLASQFNATTNTFTGAPVASGGRNSTVTSLGIPEAVDLTNGAYILRITETDRLGNRATSNLGSLALRFGVDITAPQIFALGSTQFPNATSGVNITTPNIARTDRDSVFSAPTVTAGPPRIGFGNTYATTNASNALFGIRFTDTRSGFTQVGASVNNVIGGSYSITRRRIPNTPSLANDALVETVVSGSVDAASGLSAGTFSGDPAVREFYVPISGSTTIYPRDGYYTFQVTITDRAGNTATTTGSTAANPFSYRRSVAIDNSSPRITGIGLPAVLTGGTTANFTPTGTDSLEVISAELALNYPQLSFANGTSNTGTAGQPSRLLFRRVPYYSAAFDRGFYHNPFAAITDNKLTTPIGPGTLLGSAPLAPPMPFIQDLQTVGAGSAPVPNGTAAFVKPDRVDAWFYDIRSTVNATSGNANVFADSGKSTAVQSAIFAGDVSNAAGVGVNVGQTSNNWSPIIANWSLFSSTTAGVEFRVQCVTVSCNAPFTRVDIIRQESANEWAYLGQATFAQQFDQGGTRFFRYTFTYAGQNQGQFNQPAFQAGDVIRAIGQDASGNGLSTLNSVVGVAPAPNALATTETIVTTPTVTTPITNSSAPQVITLSVSPNTNSANLVFACSSNSGFLTAQLTAANQCTLTPSGVVSSGSQAVTITFTATGSAAGFTTNTITRTVNVTRTP